MTNEELQKLTDKIEAGKASEEEKDLFIKELRALMKSAREDLEKIK